MGTLRALEADVAVPSGLMRLDAHLFVPDRASAIVLFAHGSGSSRHSPRNLHVADRLHAAGLATLLMDLLTLREDEQPQRRFDIGILAARLADAVRYLAREASTAHLPVGLFGASTGAAAALRVASELPARIGAVVSRGGRPDLAGETVLSAVRAPTLLIVGGDDGVTLALNREALATLSCPKRLEIVPGATHLFEEPGALDTVAELAAGWFREALTVER